MIKVLHIAPDIDGGGVGAVVYNYMSHMNKDGIQAEVLTSDHGYKQLLEEEFEKCNVKVITIIPRRENIKLHFQKVKEIISTGHYDVVHCHEQNWSYFYLCLAKKHGVGVRIAHSHLTTQDNNKTKIMILNLFNPLLKRTATGYFACGKEAGKYMWGKKIADSGQLYIMNNAVDSQKFEFNEDIRRQYRSRLNFEDKFVIGHVGRFSTQKNHKFLVDVFSECVKQMPNSQLVLVGKGELEDSIKQKVNDMGLTEKVTFLGLRSDVSALLNAFDVFLLPSLYEGLPVVGIEAQANGLPCIYSDTITKEAVLLDTTQTVSLDNPISCWVDEIKNIYSKKIIRKDAIRVIRDRGFDINIEAERLKKYYVEEVR